MRKKIISWKSIVGILISAVHLIPLYIALMVSLKEKSDLTSKWLPPEYFSLFNYKTALLGGNLLRALINTFFITIFALIIVLVLASLAAYPLARIRSRLSKLIINMTLVVMMIPSLSILVPLYTIYVDFHLVNTYIGIILILATFNLPISIFLISNFIREMPVDLEYAGFIDGCNELKAYTLIIVPLLKPVLTSVTILTCVKMWNDYRFARYLLQKTKLKTIAVTISQYFSEYSSDINIAAAAAIIGIIPVIIVFLLLQKQFVSGLTEGSLK